MENIEIIPMDVDNPHVYIDINLLYSYKMDHLKGWLLFRGDKLNGIYTSKDAKLRVLSYFKGGTADNIIDPTPDKKWLKAKAKKLNLIIRSKIKTAIEITCPDIFKNDFNNLSQSEGWSKTLENVPAFTMQDINTYVNKINIIHNSKSKAIKKHFQRGEQFIEENYIDVNSVHTKQNDDLFSIKGVCAASLKKKDRWIFLILSKSTAEIKFGYCQCPAGKAGTCSHAYALLKMLAKWVIDRLPIVPVEKACTSKPCTWSIPQSRGRIDKPKISDLEIKSPPSKKTRNSEESVNTHNHGISSSLYNACTPLANNTAEITELITSIKEINPSLHFLEIVNPNETIKAETKFGFMPEGSVLAVQTSLIPPNYEIYTNNIPPVDFSNNLTKYNYPKFPFENTTNKIDPYINKLISNNDQKQINFLDSLKIEIESVNTIESLTKEQADCPDWFKYRKNRFTASLCNKIKSIKTDRGLVTLAYNMIFKNDAKKSKILENKLSHGKFYEPIAISTYEKYLKTKGYNIVVEPSGLVIDKENFILVASLDGKVQVDGLFGILEVKCSEEYKNSDPKDVCFISQNSCLKYDESSNKICINKQHSYYDQIQMQLAISCQTWCDFIFYTNKGMVIDRVEFDETAWDELSERIIKFYFEQLLENLIKKQDQEIARLLLQQDLDEIPLVLSN